MIIVISVLLIGWIAVAVIGTQAYFLGEQTKPIHNRNWKSNSFEKLAKAVTGRNINYANRVPAYRMDAFASNNLPN
jgi:hypothetical protein